MSMPELGTTLRSSKSLLGRVAAGLLLLVAIAAAQTAAPQQNAPATQSNQTATPATKPPTSQAPAAQPQSQTPANQPANTAQPVNQPASNQPPSNQPAAGQPAGNQPAAGSAAPADQGQAPSGEDNGTFVFHSEAREVTLHATVVDDKNHLVNNLDKSDFTVFENDKPQQISHFQMQDYPVAVGIVIDNSGSMREKRDAVNKAAIDLVKASNPDDQVFVVNFNDEYLVVGIAGLH